MDYKIGSMRKTEVLAPCGTFEALQAAVKAGADAVYLGGSLFSARAFAGNFDREELLKAIDYCHLYGVSIYMALNTLLKNDEIGEVPEYMEPYYKAGLDGVIVQDFGVAKMLQERFPELPLHASTQMSVSSAYGAKFLKSCGFTRVVPARELSLLEIQSIKEQADIEIETFVHGAMCFAYSGKCLLSSFIGGRSGNRGRCAQPCRQCWKMFGDYEKPGKDAAKKKQGSSALHNGRFLANEYVMSMKDMCMAENVPQLIEAGIDSFKIEGRMKKPEYVALVTRSYRAAVDMYEAGQWDGAEIKRMVLEMKDIYNRGGFSTGYYFKQNGKDMLANKRPNHSGVKVGTVSKVSPPNVFVNLETDVNHGDVLEIRGTENVELTSAAAGNAGTGLQLKGKEFKNIRTGNEVFRVRNNALIESVQKEVIEPEKIVQAEALVELKAGEPVAITIWKDDVCISVSGGLAGEAKSRPTDEETVVSKMQKTGGTGVRLSVTCNIDGNVFVQMSELNALRRQGVEEFKAKLCGKYRRP